MLTSDRADTAVRPIVLLLNKFAPRLKQTIEERYATVGPFGKSFAETVAALASAEAASINVVVAMGSSRIERDAMAALPQLGLICCLGTGFEGVDVEGARGHGIVVAHSPSANASSVADLAIGLMIASVRGMFDASAYLQRGDWARRVPRALGGRGLTGRRIGIFGMGEIGERIARRAAALEMDVGYHNRRHRSDVPYTWHPTLEGLAEWADVLAIAVRASDATRHVVNADVLRKLGSEGHVVNIARGSVIDEVALIAALSDGTIAGAGLDVFESEPAVADELLRLPNVVLTPHIGGNTQEAQDAMGNMVLANLQAFFAGQPVPHPVP